jgi:hypothetical protein
MKGYILRFVGIDLIFLGLYVIYVAFPLWTTDCKYLLDTTGTFLEENFKALGYQGYLNWYCWPEPPGVMEAALTPQKLLVLLVLVGTSLISLGVNLFRRA